MSNFYMNALDIADLLDEHVDPYALRAALETQVSENAAFKTCRTHGFFSARKDECPKCVRRRLEREGRTENVAGVPQGYLQAMQDELSQIRDSIFRESPILSRLQSDWASEVTVEPSSLATERPPPYVDWLYQQPLRIDGTF